jgi:hypothetical protein
MAGISSSFPVNSLSRERLHLYLAFSYFTEPFATVGGRCFFRREYWLYR